MAKAIIAKDWTLSPLGAIETWPQSLRTTVSLCLASNFPISIAWGPSRVQIYNDGYWPICAAKHPHSMGQDFKECWFSAWPAIGDAFERAQGGETSFLENQRMFLDRNGYLEETFFTFSFSPIRDESGGVGGLFHPVTETTANMLAERRTRELRDLAARTANAQTVDQACGEILSVLGDCELDLPFGLLYVLDDDANDLRLAGSFGVLPDIAAQWPLPRGLPATRSVVEILGARFGGAACGPYPEAPQQTVVLPIGGLGSQRAAGLLIAGVSSRLPLNEAYLSFYDFLGSHVATALASARAYDEERRKVEALAELDRAKTVFFSNVSHEFRTPLTLMLAPLEDVLRRTGLDQHAREELVRVHRNGLRLLKLVNTLLDFSRIEAGRMEAVFEPTDLAQLTADLASAFRSAIDLAGLELVISCDPLEEPIYVDHEMWEKIVLNLISNALKFTFTGSIRVSLGLTGTHVELAVEDTGIGISSQELPRVFERFHRIQGARARTHEGTGIGLALVQELARLHDGAITVASEVGRGTKFTVSIPRGKKHLPSERIRGERTQSSTALGARPFVDEALRWLPAGTGIAPAAGQDNGGVPTPSAPETRGGRIVLADDNSDMRDYLKRVLSDYYEVIAVPDGEAAWEFARSNPVDLVLTDVMMPRMDGFELLRHLRGDAGTRAIPVILLSARAGEESRVEGLEAGADDYLIKPFTVRELLARVDAHIRMARIRKEAVNLQESELRFRTMADCAPVMVWTCGADGRPQYFNTGWRQFTGTAAGEWTGSVHAHDRPRCIAAFAQAAAEFGRFDLEFRLRHHDGEYHWVFCSGAPRLLPSGESLGYTFSGVDIQDRKSTEQELHLSRERLQLALDAANEGLWDWNLVTGANYYGPRYHTILGYASGELPNVYDTWLSRLHPDDRDAAVEQRDCQIVQRGGTFTTEYRLRKKNGEYTWIQSRGKVVAWRPDGSPGRIVGTIADITERRVLEEQLYLSQRLESVGRLAGGVAHDFNNLLSVINGFAEMIMADLGADDPVTGDLREIRDAGERAAGLTSQLLAFSRKQILQPVVLNLNHVVTDISKMLQRLIGEDIDLVTRLGNELDHISADPGQLQQIIVNLAVNSRDAMPSGGSLMIETSNIFLDATYASEHPQVQPGHHVMLAISDSGTGMSHEVQQQIFEPFFTTKPVGKGTGLGLATVYGIVKQSGGWIWVYSEPGKGTSFKIYFPRTGEPMNRAKKAVKTDLRGTESILVVEDQEKVRTVAVKSLRRFGYTVFAAANADEALAFCGDRKGPLHLMITDVVMPGKSGRELANQLAKARPELKVLFMSGYTENAITHQGTLDEGINYIQKPFTPESLGEKVRETLGATAAMATILLIDDDDKVRTLLRRHLTRGGYAVLEAINGRQALEIAEHAAHLELVITDMMMPEQDGPETIHALLQMQPGVKIIAISGAFGAEQQELASTLGVKAALSKPIEREHLLRTVREVLDT